MQAPLAVLVDSTDLSDVLDRNVRIGLVGIQDEVAPVLFGVPALAESEAAVFGVVGETILFERGRRSWVFVAVLAVAWWVRVAVAVPVVTGPALERLIEFFEDSLRTLGIEVLVAFVDLEVGIECRVPGNLANLVLYSAGRVAATVRSSLAANPSDRGRQPLASNSGCSQYVSG
jgi:hypothetical protein